MDARITELEIQITHLQQTLQTLDGVIIDQQSRIDALERDFRRVNIELGVLRESASEVRDPLAEKPPHY